MAPKTSEHSSPDSETAFFAFSLTHGIAFNSNQPSLSLVETPSAAMAFEVHREILEERRACDCRQEVHTLTRGNKTLHMVKPLHLVLTLS